MEKMPDYKRSTLYTLKEPPWNIQYENGNDDFNDYVDYEKIILKQSLSSYMFQNDIMNTWLLNLQSLVSLLFDQMNIMKNFKNYMVDKYHYKHSK